MSLLNQNHLRKRTPNNIIKHPSLQRHFHLKIRKIEDIIVRFTKSCFILPYKDFFLIIMKAR